MCRFIYAHVHCILLLSESSKSLDYVNMSNDYVCDSVSFNNELLEGNINSKSCSASIKTVTTTHLHVTRKTIKKLTMIRNVPNVERNKKIQHMCVKICYRLCIFLTFN